MSKLSIGIVVELLAKMSRCQKSLVLLNSTLRLEFLLKDFTLLRLGVRYFVGGMEVGLVQSDPLQSPRSLVLGSPT